MAIFEILIFPKLFTCKTDRQMKSWISLHAKTQFCFNFTFWNILEHSAQIRYFYLFETNPSRYCLLDSYKSFLFVSVKRTHKCLWKCHHFLANWMFTKSSDDVWEFFGKNAILSSDKPKLHQKAFSKALKHY